MELNRRKRIEIERRHALVLNPNNELFSDRVMLILKQQQAHNL